MAKQPKILLVFDLLEALCKNESRSVSTMFHASGNRNLSLRPGMDDFLRFLFIRNKIYIKVGIWSSMSGKETDLYLSKVFGRFQGSLMFKYASPHGNEKKDLNQIWFNFPEFNQSNTLMLDCIKDSTTPTQNHIQLPNFEQPEVLHVLKDYLKFYSYQMYYQKVNSLSLFVAKTPFHMFYTESTRPENNDTDAENRRFG